MNAEKLKQLENQVRIGGKVCTLFNIRLTTVVVTSRVLDNVQTVLFTSAKSAEYVKILRRSRKRTSKNQEVTSIFVYFHTLGLSVYANI